MKRHWVSWWSGNWADEGCTKPPFQVWVTGYRDRADTDDTGRDECSFCAVIDAESEKEIWDSIKRHYPDFEERFCNEVEPDFKPGDRFPGFENETSTKFINV